MVKNLPRNFPQIERLLGARKSVLVLGPRGAGKSFYLEKAVGLFPNCMIVNLLLEKTLLRYIGDSSLLAREIEAQLDELQRAGADVAEQPLCIFVDEVQRLPSILNAVHYCLETFKGKCFFVLTGSSARKLKQSDANLLAGRAIRVDFHPLTLEEVPHSEYFDKIMQYGSLPEVLTTSNEELIIDYLTTYVGTYLQEEIQREADVRNLEGFSRFLELAASGNGAAANFSKIARSAGVSSETVKNYYTILTDTLLANEIPAWTKSIKKQLQKASKFYFFDNGVISTLTNEIDSKLAPGNYRYGKLFENLVVNEILRKISKDSLRINLYHYRTMRGQEIDLILQKNIHTKLVAVEIKSSEKPDSTKLQALRAFGVEHPNASLFVICRTKQAYTEDEITYLPIDDGIGRVCQEALLT